MCLALEKMKETYKFQKKIEKREYLKMKIIKYILLGLLGIWASGKSSIREPRDRFQYHSDKDQLST